MFNMASSLCMDTSREISSPFNRQSPRRLSAVRQTRLHSHAAAVVLSKVSKIVQSGPCLSFCCRFFYQSVSFKTHTDFF